jgi:hypothetical protein
MHYGARNPPADGPNRTIKGDEMESKEFKVGQKWRMRGGEIATISILTARGNPLASWDNKSSVFTTKGRFYWFLNQESEFDLIELVEDVAPAPAAQLTRDQLLAENETLRDDLNDARNSLEAAAEELREADAVRAQLVEALKAVWLSKIDMDAEVAELVHAALITAAGAK